VSKDLIVTYLVYEASENKETVPGAMPRTASLCAVLAATAADRPRTDALGVQNVLGDANLFLTAGVLG
jgi:hypothetical protein